MKFRHFLLCIGLVISTFSGFFFILFHEWWIFVWIGAAFLCLCSIMAILLGEESWNRKLLWLGVIAVMIGIAHITGNIQTEMSCKMYIAANEEDLNKIVSAVISGEEDFNYGLHSYHKDSTTQDHADSLSQWLNSVNAIRVEKGHDYVGNKYVHIELWGFLDARFGLTYYEVPIPEVYYKPIQHVTGNWYR